MRLSRGGGNLFNLPAETFWLILPWPFLWVGFALIMYFKLKKEDEEEERMEREYEKANTEGKI